MNKTIHMDYSNGNFKKTINLTDVGHAIAIKITSPDWFVTECLGDGDSVNLSREAAAELRDALIEMLPLPVDAPTRTSRRAKGAQTYRGNGNHTWEDVEDGTRRLRVPGGFLYRYRSASDEAAAMAFVPMPETVGYAV